VAVFHVPQGFGSDSSSEHETITNAALMIHVQLPTVLLWRSVHWVKFWSFSTDFHSSTLQQIP
jgi:hypothetical protein